MIYYYNNSNYLRVLKTFLRNIYSSKKQFIFILFLIYFFTVFTSQYTYSQSTQDYKVKLESIAKEINKSYDIKQKTTKLIRGLSPCSRFSKNYDENKKKYSKLKVDLSILTTLEDSASIAAKVLYDYGESNMTTTIDYYDSYPRKQTIKYRDIKRNLEMTQRSSKNKIIKERDSKIPKNEFKFNGGIITRISPHVKLGETFRADGTEKRMTFFSQKLLPAGDYEILDKYNVSENRIERSEVPTIYGGEGYYYKYGFIWISSKKNKKKYLIICPLTRVRARYYKYNYKISEEYLSKFIDSHKRLGKITKEIIEKYNNKLLLIKQDSLKIENEIKELKSAPNPYQIEYDKIRDLCRKVIKAEYVSSIHNNVKRQEYRSVKEKYDNFLSEQRVISYEKEQKKREIKRKKFLINKYGLKTAKKIIIGKYEIGMSKAVCKEIVKDKGYKKIIDRTITTETWEVGNYFLGVDAFLYFNGNKLVRIINP